MWKCPSCGKETETGWICPDCGFDESMNYRKCPVITKLSKEQRLDWSRTVKVGDGGEKAE